MEFIETSIFTKQIRALLHDDDYASLQETLAKYPHAGDVIPGGGGLRKIRWRSGIAGKGKRGGLRMIYYCESEDRIYLLFAYDKTRQGDLTRPQLKALSDYVRGGLL